MSEEGKRLDETEEPEVEGHMRFSANDEGDSDDENEVEAHGLRVDAPKVDAPKVD